MASLCNYIAAKGFMKRVRFASHALTIQQCTALKNRALSGDISGAEAELARLIESAGGNNDRRSYQRIPDAV